jgi:antirestriction protein ArdC
MARPHAETRPLYNRVTDAIIADLERGVRPWTKPWTSGSAGPISRPLRHSGESYRGINVLLLWSEAFEHGYASPMWVTFRQALALGGHVRKGEHGATVVYANRIVREDADAPEGEDGVRSIPFLKAYTVFNVTQIDSLPEGFLPVALPPVVEEARIASLDDFVLATGADVRHGGNQAYYAPGPDFVQMPPRAAFSEGHDYYATLLHELTHDAERRIMPRGRPPGLGPPCFSHAVSRHNQSASRKARSRSSGRYRPGGMAGAAIRLSACSFSFMSACR